jgi:hypothetical protein
MDSSDFNVVAVTYMQIFTIRCPRISISHNTVSVQLDHGCKSMWTLACHVQILTELLISKYGKYVDIKSFADTRHNAQMRHAYRFESEKW